MVNRLHLTAIIPAAGLSSRMGAFKPLLPFGNSTVIEVSVENALSCSEKAVVVLGKRGGELKELLLPRFGNRLSFVENPDYAFADMLSSVQLGVQALEQCDGFFITPGDMPMITPSVYRILAENFTPHNGEILLPVVEGRRGHPPLISFRLISSILRYDGIDGLRGFYRGQTVREIAVTDAGILMDMDTPEDYLALKSLKEKELLEAAYNNK